MKVSVKLYGLLRLRRENYDPYEGITIDILEGFILKDLLNSIAIDFQEVGCIFVNDNNILDFGVHLRGGDIIKIFPHFPSGG